MCHFLQPPVTSSTLHPVDLNACTKTQLVKTFDHIVLCQQRTISSTAWIALSCLHMWSLPLAPNSLSVRSISRMLGRPVGFSALFTRLRFDLPISHILVSLPKQFIQFLYRKSLSIHKLPKIFRRTRVLGATNVWGQISSGSWDTVVMFHVQ